MDKWPKSKLTLASVCTADVIVIPFKVNPKNGKVQRQQCSKADAGGEIECILFKIFIYPLTFYMCLGANEARYA